MLAQFARGFHSLLFPMVCLGCQHPIEGMDRNPVCPACRSRLPRCSFPWIAHGPSLNSGVSPFLYDGTAKEMVLALKYQGRISLAPFLAESMALELRRRPEYLPADRGGTVLAAEEMPRRGCVAADLIVPVPLHPVRLRERTFNQAELLAQFLSREFAIPCRSDLLIRCRATRPQAELTRNERVRNVHGAFDLRGEARLHGLKILLVDDVLTTGSTAEACARLLKSAGARTVTAVTATYDPIRKRDISGNVPIP